MGETINLLLFAVFCLAGGFFSGLLLGRLITEERVLKQVGEHRSAIRWKDFKERYRDKIDMAQFYYGKNWLRTIKTCDNAHLAGDCILCGGEAI